MMIDIVCSTVDMCEESDVLFLTVLLNVQKIARHDIEVCSVKVYQFVELLNAKPEVPKLVSVLVVDLCTEVGEKSHLMNGRWTRIESLEFPDPWFLRLRIHDNARRVFASLAWLLTTDQVHRESLRIS